MKVDLYDKELLKKLVTEGELEILGTVWDDSLSVEEKIKRLLEE